MGVVELDGDSLGQQMPVSVMRGEAEENFLKRGLYEEVFLL